MTIALAACGVAFALCARPLPGRKLAWLAVLPMFFPARDVPAPGAARVVVLDVGHGLAVSVATHAHRLLFDAGPSFRSGFDSGDDIVLPALAAGGPRGLDRLIVSHADNDHAGGAAAVLAAFPRADVLKGPDVAAPRGPRLRARRALGVGRRRVRDPAPRGRLRRARQRELVRAEGQRARRLGADHGRHRGARRERGGARGRARERRRRRAAPRQRDVVVASVRRRGGAGARARVGRLRESLGLSETGGQRALGARAGRESRSRATTARSRCRSTTRGSRSRRSAGGGFATGKRRPADAR